MYYFIRVDVAKSEFEFVRKISCREIMKTVIIKHCAWPQQRYKMVTRIVGFVWEFEWTAGESREETSNGDKPNDVLNVHRTSSWATR